MDIVQLPIIAKNEISPGIFEMHLGIKDKQFLFQPGQYIRITLPQLNEPDSRGNYRDFSIASSPNNKKELIITLRASESAFKKSLLALPLGAFVKVSGPFGDLLLFEEAPASAFVFIAAGIGITPFLSAIRFFAEQNDGRSMLLLYGTRSNDDAIYLDELKKLSKQYPFFQVQHQTGLIDVSLIKTHIDTLDHPDFFLSGSPEAVRALEKKLLKIGILQEKIHMEEFLGYEPGESAAGQIAFDTSPRTLGIDTPQGDFAALLDTLNKTALVSKTNADGTITYANDKFIEISKYTKEELIGQNHRILKSGHHTKDFYRNLWNAISSGRIWRGEIKNRAKDGTFYWVDTSITPIMGEHGVPTSYISVRFPITERKEVEERNAEIAEHLRLVNKELETFVYSVSQDLLVPLRTIDGFSKILSQYYSK